MTDDALHHYRGVRHRYRPVDEAGDPFTTEIIRHALNSAANQMKRALIRTSFSPTIYAQSDFAIALYDPHYQMLAQAPALPAFMGTMSFCVQAAVAANGGADALRPGDVLLYNWPYGTGSHAQDMAVITPAFDGDVLVGYAANKAHLRDIGAKDPYGTDTTDVFQEGVIFPGVKLYREGVRDDSIFRMLLANTRAPHAVTGDVQAQVTSAGVGVEELKRVIGRFGADKFWSSVDQMYDHGEALIRDFFTRIPDGRYIGRGSFDNDGLSEDEITFELAVEVVGSTIRVDYGNAPDAAIGPVNCPLPSTVSGTRVAISMLAGGGQAPNEGHFQPIEVVTRPGSIFHPVPPQPCFLYGWPLTQAIEAIFRAIGEAVPGAAPSGSAGDICAVQVYTHDPVTNDLAKVGCALPVGQGAHAGGDGSTVFVVPVSNSQLISAELEEAKYDVLFEKLEFTPDSAGPGEKRGGLGWERRFRVLSDVRVISAIDRTKVPGNGQHGGLAGTANHFSIEYPDGSVTDYRKKTWFPVPAGSSFRIRCGGGGGYGAPRDRTVAAVVADFREGFVTRLHVGEHYPHALAAIDALDDA